METNQTQNWRVTVLETIKMMLVRPLMTNFKRLSADCNGSACSPLPQPVEVLAHWLSVRGVSLWTGVPTQEYQGSTSLDASIPNKANSPFHQPGLFTGFWVVSSQIPLFGYILILKKIVFSSDGYLLLEFYLSDNTWPLVMWLQVIKKQSKLMHVINM